MFTLRTDTLQRQLKGQDGGMVANAGVNTNTPGVIVTGVGSASDMCTQNHVGSQVGTDDAGACQMDMDLSKSEGTQVGGGLHQSVGTSTKSTGTRSKDFSDDMVSGNNDACLVWSNLISLVLLDTRRALARHAPPAQRNQQQHTTQDQEHRGHECRYEHTEAHAKADAEHREPRHIAGDGPTTLQLL